MINYIYTESSLHVYMNINNYLLLVMHFIGMLATTCKIKSAI